MPKRRRLFLGLTFLLVTAALSGRSAVACSCVDLASLRCDRSWAEGEFIFVGTVQSKTSSERRLADGSSIYGDHEFHFADVEILKGAPPPSTTISLRTGSGGGDCGYPFVIGKCYLDYASISGRELRTSICSNTTPGHYQSATIAALRQLRNEARSPDLFGNIGRAATGPGWEDLTTIQPLARVAASDLLRVELK